MDFRSLSRTKARWASVVLILVSLSACVKNEYALMERYKEQMKAARTSALANDASSERAHFEAALAITREMDWPEGTAGVLIALSRSYSGSNEYTLAETSLRDAQVACANSGCDDSIIWSIYENLVILFAVVMKDISKAEDLIREIESGSNRFSDKDDFDRRLMRFKDDLALKGKNN